MPGPAGELRFDPLTREWVNIVGGRQARPNLPTSGCPFCLGGLEAPDPYDVRWFPNRWPAYSSGDPVDVVLAEAAGVTSVPAATAGRSEVSRGGKEGSVPCRSPWSLCQ
jgi:UDPglucose--hexose-1-phosphate uridylyltransferase